MSGLPEAAEQERGPEAVPRIYVASLSDYNAGILHGTWLDAATEPDELWDGINEMLAASPTTARYGDPAEEWAIHDYENFGPIALSEWERIEHVATLARGIVRHGNAFAAWWDLDQRSDDDDIESQFENQYLGQYTYLSDYVDQYLDDIGFDVDDMPGVPESIQPYVIIDTAAMARDLEAGGAISTVEADGGVYVFANE
jgi:antirestriction protein